MCPVKCGMKLHIHYHYQTRHNVKLLCTSVKHSCLFSYTCKMAGPYVGLYNALSAQDPVTEQVLSCVMNGVS